MASKKRVALRQGATIWLPCDAKAGMFPTEKYVVVTFSGDLKVAGLVPLEDVRTEGGEGRGSPQVRAVVAKMLAEHIALLFRGEIFSATNPVAVPRRMLEREFAFQRG